MERVSRRGPLAALLRSPDPAGFVGYVIGKEQVNDDERAAATTPENTEGIEAAPAFSTEDLAAEPREAWITNGGSLANQPLLAARPDRHGQRGGSARASG